MFAVATGLSMKDMHGVFQVGMHNQVVELISSYTGTCLWLNQYEEMLSRDSETQGGQILDMFSVFF